METTNSEDDTNDPSDRLLPQLDRVKQRLGSWNGRVSTFIKDHPGACLLGALALGYVVARVARRQRS